MKKSISSWLCLNSMEKGEARGDKAEHIQQYSHSSFRIS